jgi:hypothetical protein
MRTFLIALAALGLTATAALAEEWTWSSQTLQLQTMIGYPPPADATKLEDLGGGTWVSHQNGVLLLTAEAPGSLTQYVTFELGEYDAWRMAAPDKKGRPVVEAFVGGTMKTLTFDLSRVHSKRTLKVTIKTRS